MVDSDKNGINNNDDTVEDMDDLDAYIAERDKREPGFAALVEAALQRRREARARGEDPNAEPDEDEANKSVVQPTAPHTKR
ncbi:MAG TPA: hypothetical protein VFX24_17150 [Ktedonobacterales bacterium]|jgi:hypothetical protein|nr:hypothetical protein [Ktedonobacterales bacterium]